MFRPRMFRPRTFWPRTFWPFSRVDISDKSKFVMDLKNCIKLIQIIESFFFIETYSGLHCSADLSQALEVNQGNLFH